MPKMVLLRQQDCNPREEKMRRNGICEDTKLKWLNVDSLFILKVTGTSCREGDVVYWQVSIAPENLNEIWESPPWVSNFMSWLLQYWCSDIAYLTTQFWQISKVSNFIKSKQTKIIAFFNDPYCFVVLRKFRTCKSAPGPTAGRYQNRMALFWFS